MSKTLTYVVLCTWSFICLFPIGWIYLEAFQQPQDVYSIPPKFLFVPTLHNFGVVLGLSVPEELASNSPSQATQLDTRFPHGLLNSTVVTVATVVIGLAIALLCAYALARMRMRGKGMFLGTILISRVIPPAVLALPLYVMWQNFHLLDTQLGLILAYLVGMLPFAVWLLRGFLVDIPEELEQAAMIDGCSRLGALFRVIVPVTAPGLATTAILSGISIWNEFLSASLLTSNAAKTLPPSIRAFITDQAIQWGRLYAASALMLVPVIIFSLIVQRHIARGLTAGAVKGA